MVPLYAVIERARRRANWGGIEPSEVVGCVVGPLFYRRWFSRQPLGERFVTTLVDRVVSWSKQ